MRKTWAGAGIIACALAAGTCGKKGAPLPPFRPDPQPIADLKVGQQADRLVVSYTTPRTTIENQRLDLHDIEIFVADRAGDLAKVGEVTRVRVAPGEARVESLPLPPLGTPVRVAVRARNKSGRSTMSKVESFKSQPAPAAPTDVTAENDPGGVVVAWTAPIETPTPTPMPMPPTITTTAPAGVRTPASAAPAATATPTIAPTPTPAVTPSPTPASVRGFQVRRRGPTGTAMLITEKPVAASPFLDETPLASGRWCYTVRRLVSSLPLVMSADSDEACVDVRDVRPPQPPTSLAIFPRSDGLELTWSPAPDADVVSYRIYRSPIGTEPERIGEVPAAERQYIDTTALTGTRYRYRVTAVDETGNESAPGTPAEAARP